ncbi:MAG: rhodanese [Verrucomicrobia bacterium]|nr:rhodanese [Verrucomicrobiota bacterium]
MKMKNLSPEEFKNMLDEENTLVIDVRTPEEEIEGVIEGSLNINIMDPSFPTKIETLDKAKKYLVFCRSGGRSATACQFMAKNGFDTYNLEGGIIAWNAM